MLLAAGRGERMRPLTDKCPKPLLQAGGKPLIVWHLERLVAAGFSRVVINHAHLGAMLVSALGDGERMGIELTYSAEPEGALETAGGIANARHLLGNEPFLVVSADVFCDWDFARASAFVPEFSDLGRLAHIVLVNNPAHHPDGDFHLHDGVVDALGEPRLTYSGIGIFHPAFFESIQAGEVAKLAPLLRRWMGAGRVSGEFYAGQWTDVGTPERLQALDYALRQGRGHYG